MQSFLRLLAFLCVSIIFFAASVVLYPTFSKNHKSSGLLRQEMLSFENDAFIFAAIPQTTLEIKTAVASEDARPILIEQYLTHYKSPMAGHGDYIVKTADHFSIDPYLIVAIAQQESNLGKLMPPNCHNAWGWGIHSKGTLCFDTWQEGINTFTQGLAEKYVAYGLRTPEQIMTRYNATSPGGAWAKGVNQFLDELHSGNW
ncbi:MAG: hypothetical protein DPW11_02070 [bacterium]|nr:hypothetical protein [bacterium]RIK50781.1 MAG: hypothetical protein DCC61_04460 [Candidatus Microgenomates bacterium]